MNDRLPADSRAAPAEPAPLRRTPLHALHRERGARMVPFAGYEMPLHYPPGILKEHLWCRESAGLFDVSHMGQFALRAASGLREDAARALEELVPADLAGLAAGRQRYGVFTNDDGGILDDLMIAARDDHLLLVVNAARKSDDMAHLRMHLAGLCTVESLDDRALIALQGPRAEAALKELWHGAGLMRFMDVREASLMGAMCVVSRSGYTGEDGFEISVPAARAEALARELLKNPVVAPVGLGARDSLRLEAGLCLHGADLDATTTPVEAALEWAIPASRRARGARPGGFPGAAIVQRQLDAGPPRRRVGLRPEGRAPVRASAGLFESEAATQPLGVVTSGGFGPSLDAPIAMGYVPPAQAAPDTLLFAEARGRRLPLRVATLPFIPHRYRR